MSARIMTDERIFTLDQVCQRLGFHRQTVIKFIAEGELTASKLGREYRIRESDLDDFMRRKQIKPKDEKSQ
jgi:excisionase family DNA binding protein